MNSNQVLESPTKAFRLSALAALIVGVVSYAIGLYNADMALNEKGYYLVVLLYGLFAAISAQKSVRDRAENIATSNIYFVLCGVSAASAIALLCIGLYNANLLLSEKGFFGMAYILSLFAAITVQKNLRDVQALEGIDTRARSIQKNNHIESVENDNSNNSAQAKA